MAHGAFWRMGASALAAAWLAGPADVTKADDDPQEKAREKSWERELREPIARAFRLAGGGSHLGVSLADVGSEDRARLKLSEERGALVKEVQADTPAAKAGLKADDVIVRFDGEAVRSSAQLSRLVRETPPGRAVAIEVNRDGATQRLTATLGEGRPFAFSGDLGDVHVEVPPIASVPPLPPMPPMEPLMRDLDRARRGLFLVERPRRLGITYQELSGQLARYFKVDDGSLLVSDVSEDSPAGKAGIKAGDIIVRVNGKPVSQGRDLREEVGRAEADSQLALGIQRDGKALEVKVTLGARSRAERKPSI